MRYLAALLFVLSCSADLSHRTTLGFEVKESAVCSPEDHRNTVALAYEAVLYEAAQAGLLKRYPVEEDINFSVCLRPVSFFDCGVPGVPSVAGCSYFDWVHVATRAPNWRKVLVHELIGHFALTGAISVPIPESAMLADSGYKRILNMAYARISEV